MKHFGKARKAAYKLILFSLIVVGLILATGIIATLFGGFVVAVTPFLVVLWLLFAVFTLYFFRDPNARVPLGNDLVVAPAHGKVDVVDTVNEPLFMGGQCQRISIFLSVIDVHVQNAPISAKVSFYKYSTGQFLNALRTDSAQHNENVLLGFQDQKNSKTMVGVRLIAGVLARRIVPFVQLNDEVARGDRIALIQFGSRADVYLPAHARLKVKVGDRVVGGETVVAEFVTPE
jgi:phosphatidylserine decarboxylase